MNMTNDKTSQQNKNKKKKHIVIPIISGVVLLFLVIMIIIGLSEMTSFKSHAKQMKADLKEVVYSIKDDDFTGAEKAMEGVDNERLYLRDKINDALMALVEDGTYDKIGQKYPEIYDYLSLGK